MIFVVFWVVRMDVWVFSWMQKYKKEKNKKWPGKKTRRVLAHSIPFLCLCLRLSERARVRESARARLLERQHGMEASC